MTCDICEQNAADFVVGDTHTGAQQFLCVGCAARSFLALAVIVLPPAELADAAAQATSKPAETAASEAPEGTGRPKRKKATKEPTAPQGPAGGPTQVPPAAEDGGD